MHLRIVGNVININIMYIFAVFSEQNIRLIVAIAVNYTYVFKMISEVNICVDLEFWNVGTIRKSKLILTLVYQS